MWKRLILVILLMTLVVLLSTFVGAVQSQTAELPPLTEPGPYGVRMLITNFVDEDRGDWTLQTFIWYPADKTKGTPLMPGSAVLKDAPPDRSGAPYPLIVYSHGWTGAWCHTAMLLRQPSTTTLSLFNMSWLIAR